MDFSNKITLIKNSRGIYDLDTIKGCYYGMKLNKNGCYGNCYAAKNLRQYGFDFTKSQKRVFHNFNQLILIKKEIMSINMPFIRIGVSGDPSENWKHLISIINLIHGCNKTIVIITKHWKPLTNLQLKELSRFDICFNTSVSALDNNNLILYRLNQYNRIKKYCKSILRIVSCNFNLNNLTGFNLYEIQKKLFENNKTIDTIFRVNKNNIYVKYNIIKIEKIKFLNNYCFASIYNKNTFFGYCNKCLEMCGLNLN